MDKRLNNLLSICIYGKNCSSELQDCIRHLTALTDKIFFVDLGSDDQSKSRASELGACVTDLDSLEIALKTEWILFIRPNEKPEVSSYGRLHSLLLNRNLDAYGVMAKRPIDPSVLTNFQWARKLRQYKNIEHIIDVPIFEICLVRIVHAEKCLTRLLEDSGPECFNINSQVQNIITMNLIDLKQKEESTKNEDNELSYLKEEINHGPDAGDGLWELSHEYNSFGVVYKGLLESFEKGMEQGFGSDDMYISMLGYLCRFTYYTEARHFYEKWTSIRPKKKNHELLKIGAQIYSNLMELDKAIELYQQVVDDLPTYSHLVGMGKLYLAKGDNLKALKYLKEASEKEPDPFLEKIISIIEDPQWRPLMLSVCMIVQDEEKLIERSLDSIRKIADEIIVVDTGSNDNTKKIAVDKGAELIEMKWQDDFSAARNLALSAAKGDYVLCLDADEHIDYRERFSLAVFKRLLPPSKDTAFSIKIETEDEDEEMAVMLRLPSEPKRYYHTRLFPNLEGIEFRGAAFEDVDASLAEIGLAVAKDALFKIAHSRGDNIERSARKYQAVVKALPSIDHPIKALEGALYFLKIDDLDLAFTWLDKTRGLDPRLRAKIASLYLSRGQSDRARQIIDKGLREGAESVDLTYTLARVHYEEGHYPDVIHLLENGVDLVEETMGRESAAAAAYYCGMAALETGALVLGIDMLASAHDKDPLNPRYKVASIFAFAVAGQIEKSLLIAGRILAEQGLSFDKEIAGFEDAIELLLQLKNHCRASGLSEEVGILDKVITHILQILTNDQQIVDEIKTIITQ